MTRVEIMEQAQQILFFKGFSGWVSKPLAGGFWVFRQMVFEFGPQNSVGVPTGTRGST